VSEPRPTTSRRIVWPLSRPVPTCTDAGPITYRPGLLATITHVAVMPRRRWNVPFKIEICWDDDTFGPRTVKPGGSSSLAFWGTSSVSLMALSST
jgi:hypothetical protein